MLASFVEMFRTHREETAHTIAELVRRVVDGETLPPELLVKAAADAGMTAEDVDAMAQRMRHRDGLRRTAMGIDGAAAEVAKLTDAIGKHDAVLSDAKSRHAAATAPLREQLAEAESRHATATRAEADLLDPRWMEPALVERLRVAKAERLAAAMVASDLKQENQKQTRRHEEARAKLVKAGHDPEKLETLWRNESPLPDEDAAWWVLELVRGTAQAKEAAEKLPAALAALEAAERRLDEIQTEARAS